MEKSSGLLWHWPQTTRTMQGICLFSCPIFCFQSTHHPLFLPERVWLLGGEQPAKFQLLDAFYKSFSSFPRRIPVAIVPLEIHRFTKRPNIDPNLWSTRLFSVFYSLDATKLVSLSKRFLRRSSDSCRSWRKLRGETKEDESETSVLWIIFDPETRLNTIE
jgi:hypothetical protein